MNIKIDIVGTALYFQNKYLIYIDKSGTSSKIKEKDPIYDNRIGFYEMSIFYEETYERAKQLLDNEFLFFGFSDTILILTFCDNPTIIGKLAAKIYCYLLYYRIHSKIFITYGDFGCHDFEKFKTNKNIFICPVYGRTLLKAYELEKTKIEYFGVFIEKQIIENFKLKTKINLNKNLYVGFLDLKFYLAEEEFNDCLKMMEDFLKEENINELKKAILEYPAISKLIDLMEEKGIPYSELEQKCIKPTITRLINEKEAVKNKIKNTYELLVSNKPLQRTALTSAAAEFER